MIRKFQSQELTGHRVRVIAFSAVCLVTANVEVGPEQIGMLLFIEKEHEGGREIIFDAVREEEETERRHRRNDHMIRYLINIREGP